MVCMRERVHLFVAATCCCTAAVLLTVPEPDGRPVSAKSLAVHHDQTSHAHAIPSRRSETDAETVRVRLQTHDDAPAVRVASIRVRSLSGWPTEHALVAVDKRLPHGAWVEERRLRTDREGMASTRLLDDDAPRRARLLGGSMGSEPLSPRDVTTELRTADSAAISIELVDADSRPLLGAQAVTVRVGGLGYAARTSRTNEALWHLEMTRDQDRATQPRNAQITVTDTLGQTWTRTVTLQPGEMNRVTPASTLAVLRSGHTRLRDFVRDHTGHGVRVRWSLETRDATRHGSTWLRSRGFHAVTPVGDAPDHCAQLRMRATSSTSPTVQQVVQWPLATPSIDIDLCRSQLQQLRTSP